MKAENICFNWVDVRMWANTYRVSHFEKVKLIKSEKMGNLEFCSVMSTLLRLQSSTLHTAHCTWLIIGINRSHFNKRFIFTDANISKVSFSDLDNNNNDCDTWTTANLRQPISQSVIPFHQRRQYSILNDHLLLSVFLRKKIDWTFGRYSKV